MFSQPLLVEALGDLVLELEELNTGADQTDDIQCLLRKVSLNAKSVIAKIGSHNAKLLNHMDKTKLTMVDIVEMSGYSSLVKVNPKQSAMLNHVVLSCVFENMNAVDLLHLRLVCKKWNLLIMETISNPSNKKSLKAILNEDNMHNLDLSYLNQMSGYSRKFPISILQLNLDFWDTEREDISLFRDIHWEHVKTLIIKDCVRSHQAVDFRDLLTNYFGNVEHLIVKTMLKSDVFDDWHFELFDDVLLPSLKTIDFDGNLSFGLHVFRDLLRSAFNLETVTGQSPKIVSAAGALNKVGTMKKIQISGSATATVQALAVLNPTLTHLDIDPAAASSRSHNFFHQLKLIFRSSKDSLESVRIPALDLGLGKYTKIKKVPNLKRLHVYHPPGKKGDKKKRPGPIFPERTILAKKFPQLNTLVLQLTIFDKPSILEYFPGENYSNWFDKSIDRLMTLQNLELDCKFITKFGLKSLARKFPNVRSIKAKNIYDIFENEDCIWYLPWDHLETLELRGFRYETDLDSYQSLDSLFTGFPDSICRNLRQLGKAEGKNIDVDMKILQTKRSFRDLQHLKKLRIVFDHESNSEFGAVADKKKLDVLYDRGEPLITELTCLYAFNVMPTLHRVIIAYDHHQQNSPALAASFEPLADFVFITFDHEPLISRTSSY